MSRGAAQRMEIDYFWGALYGLGLATHGLGELYKAMQLILFGVSCMARAWQVMALGSCTKPRNLITCGVSYMAQTWQSMEPGTCTKQ